jgi:hypothetical protein
MGNMRVMTTQDGFHGVESRVTDDRLPADVLWQRVLTLTVEQLESVIAYEGVWGDQRAVVEMARQRLNELRGTSQAAHEHLERHEMS